MSKRRCRIPGDMNDKKLCRADSPLSMVSIEYECLKNNKEDI